MAAGGKSFTLSISSDCSALLVFQMKVEKDPWHIARCQQESGGEWSKTCVITKLCIILRSIYVKHAIQVNSFPETFCSSCFGTLLGRNDGTGYNNSCHRKWGSWCPDMLVANITGNHELKMSLWRTNSDIEGLKMDSADAPEMELLCSMD